LRIYYGFGLLLCEVSNVFQGSIECNKGVFADIIVYIFAHLHTALHAEGNMLDLNRLQEIKELVKLNTCIWLFLGNIQGEMSFKYYKISGWQKC